MSYAIFTDSCANLPGNLLRRLDISVMPCSYRIGGKEISFNGDIDHFDAKAHYDLLRAGEVISTSLINADAFLAAFRPVLAQGRDLVYVGISSGISGTFQAANMAVTELKEEFPDRTIRTVDSMGAGLGTGLLACRLADFRKDGLDASAAADKLETLVPGLCEFFHRGFPAFPPAHRPHQRRQCGHRHHAEHQAPAAGGRDGPHCQLRQVPRPEAGRGGHRAEICGVGRGPGT